MRPVMPTKPVIEARVGQSHFQSAKPKPLITPKPLTTPKPLATPKPPATPKLNMTAPVVGGNLQLVTELKLRQNSLKNLNKPKETAVYYHTDSGEKFRKLEFSPLPAGDKPQIPTTISQQEGIDLPDYTYISCKECESIEEESLVRTNPARQTSGATQGECISDKM